MDGWLIVGVSGLPYIMELTRFPTNQAFSPKYRPYEILGALGLSDHDLN